MGRLPLPGLSRSQADRTDVQVRQAADPMFPVSSLTALAAKQFVLDGEIVIPVDGKLSFDDLLLRIYPAASRILKHTQATPCMFIVF